MKRKWNQSTISGRQQQPTSANYGKCLVSTFPTADEFILEGWQDMPPYRRDFDMLAYVEETYRERPGRVTYDPTKYMKEQLYPDGK